MVVSNSAVQPESHSRPMERSDPEARAGKIWARRAFAGRCGRGKRPVCVEEMVLPSGKVTCTGLRVGVTSVQGPSIIMK